MVKLDVRQIRLTTPIKNAIIQLDPNIHLGDYKTNTNYQDQGFPLSRIENMMNIHDFTELLHNEPIEVVKVTQNGKSVGISIDGTKKQLYDVINGRHRLVRTIVEGKSTIPATVITHGGKNKKSNKKNNKAKNKTARRTRNKRNYSRRRRAR